MTDLRAKHQKALQRVKKVGLSIYFTRFDKDYDPASDTYGEPEEVRTLGWAVELMESETSVADKTTATEEEVIVLLFVPVTYGDLPRPNANVTWAGSKRTVRKVEPIRPAGQSLAAKVHVV